MVSTHGYVAAEPPLGAADTGGQVVYVLELSKKLSLLGYEVDIWTRQFEDQRKSRSSTSACASSACLAADAVLSTRNTSSSISQSVGKRPALHRKTRPALSVFQQPLLGRRRLPRQRLSEALDIPHVHTPHSLGLWKKQLMERDYPNDAERFEKKYNFTQRINEETILYRSCEEVIATTPLQVDMILQDYGAPAEQVHMIPPGYDDNRFYPMSAATRNGIRQRLGFSGKVVLAIGRLARNKGYDLLIERLLHRRARLPDAVLHLAIGGTQLNPTEQRILDELKAQATKLGVNGRVVFNGFVADADLADCYRAADVFVLSSRYDRSA